MTGVDRSRSVHVAVCPRCGDGKPADKSTPWRYSADVCEPCEEVMSTESTQPNQGAPMNNANTYISTINGASYGFTMGVEKASVPAQTPTALIATRAVQAKVGWLGQVIIDREIVAESPAQETAEEAQTWANSYVVKRIRKLFA